MYPAEQTELLLEVALFQRHNEAHETDSVQREADNSVIGSEWKEVRICEDDVLRASTCQNSLYVKMPSNGIQTLK